MKEEVIGIIKDLKDTQQSSNFTFSDEEDSSDNEELYNYACLKTEFEILREKYSRLSLSYEEEKKQFNKLSSIEPPIMKKTSEVSLNSPQELESELFIKNGVSPEEKSGKFGTPRLQKSGNRRKLEDFESEEK